MAGQSSDDLLDLLRGPKRRQRRYVRPWKWALAPAQPTPNKVRRTIEIPGWLYDRFFFRASLLGVTVDEVITHELLKTDIPEPDRGDQKTWLVSNAEKNPWTKITKT